MYIKAGITEDVVASDGGFSMPDPGDYVATVSETEDGETKKQDGMLTVTFQIDSAADGSETDQAGMTVKNWYAYGTDFGKRRMKNLLDAALVERDEEGNFDDDDLKGRQVIISVEHDEQEGKDDEGNLTGKTKVFCRVLRERALDGAEMSDSDTEVTEVEEEELPKSARNGNGNGNGKLHAAKGKAPAAGKAPPPRTQAKGKAQPRR